MNLKQFLRLPSRHAGSIAVIAIASGLAILALQWLGYDFSLFSTAYIGDLQDTLATGWQLQQAMDNLLQRPYDLGYSPAFYPEPNSFSYMVAPYGIAIVALPVYLITGNNTILTYNLYLVATFALTAWATYLLVKHLLDAPWIVSAIIGLMVAFAQFRFLHLMHIGILSTQFYILTLYCLHRLISTPLLRWSIGLALANWLGLIANGYLGAMSMITTAIVLMYIAVRMPQLITKRFAGHFTIAIAIGLVLAWPFLEFRLNNSTLLAGQPYSDFLQFSATPADWLSGNSYIYRGVTPFRGESTLFIGLLPIVLSIVAWRYRKEVTIRGLKAKHRALSPSAVVLVYGMIILAGYTLTLGPVLRINETPVAPLPYMLLINLPGFSGLRAMARFIILATVGTAVLSAFTLTFLSMRISKFAYWAVLLVVIGLLAVELTPYFGKTTMTTLGPFAQSAGERPLQPMPVETDVPVYNWLAKQPPGTAIMNYPVTGTAPYSYMLYQQLHKQPMLNAPGSAYFPEWYRNVNWNAFPSSPIMNLLQERGYSYILVHHDLLSDEENAELESRWAEYHAVWGEIPCVGRFAEVNVFEARTIPNLAPSQPIIVEFDQPVPGEGWAEPEIWRGQLFQNVSFQWTTNEIATINITLDEIAHAAGDEISIQFRVISAMTPDILESVALSVNGEQIHLVSWTDDEGSRIFRGTVPRAALANNQRSASLAIQVSQVVSPQSLGRNDDPRLLGLAIDWLRIGPNLSLGCESYRPEG